MKTNVILFCVIVCMSCNSFDQHTYDHITVYNSMQGEEVEVVFSADHYYKSNIEPVKNEVGRNFYHTSLKPGELVKVGTVNRRYVPQPGDINVRYIELRYAGDTIVLKGKKAIYTSFYNEETKLWRYHVK